MDETRAAEDPWWPPDETRETDVDDDFDWDTECGRLEPGPEPGPPRPWVPPAPRVAPRLERDVRVAVLEPGGAGDFVRACRAAAGLSQRALASAAGVPQSTVARLEADVGSDHAAGDRTRASTLVQVAQACGVRLVGLVDPPDPDSGGEPELLRVDLGQRHRDNGGRMLPAHVVNRPVPEWFGGWWGDQRYPKGRCRPRRGYRLGERYRDLPPVPPRP